MDLIAGEPDICIQIDDLQEQSEEVADILGEHHWLVALLRFALHWCYFERKDKNAAFTNGLEFLDWFRTSGLSAPGYVLRRVFLLGSRCFRHARLQSRKSRGFWSGDH